ECCVAVVAPQRVWSGGHEARDIQVDVAIVIEVDESKTQRRAIELNAGCSSTVAEAAVGFAVIKSDSVLQPEDDVAASVVVVVADRAALRLSGGVESHSSGDVGKPAASGIAIELRRAAGQEQIGPAIGVEIDEAGARPLGLPSGRRGQV